MSKLIPVYMARSEFGPGLVASPKQAFEQLVQDTADQLLATMAPPQEIVRQALLTFAGQCVQYQRQGLHMNLAYPTTYCPKDKADDIACRDLFRALQGIVEAPVVNTPSAVHTDAEYRHSIREEARAGAKDQDIGEAPEEEAA